MNEMLEQLFDSLRDCFSGNGGAHPCSPSEAAELFRAAPAEPCGGLAELADSVSRVANDMKMPVPGVCAAEGSFGMHLANDPSNPFDDTIAADPEIVSSINECAGDPRAFDVVAAHEMGHAKIAPSGLRDRLSPQAEELLCDVNAGLYAGEHGAPTDVYDTIIAESPADSEHPAGDIRHAVFHAAKAIGEAHPDPNTTNLVDRTIRELDIERLCDAIFEKFDVVA